MKHNGMRALFFVIAVLMAFVASPVVAHAHMGAERFKVEKRVSVPPKGPRGQLEVRSPIGEPVRLLRGEGGDYTGAFEVRNSGPGPLTINRVYVLDADDDPRSPSGLVAQPEGGTRSSIAPGQSRKYFVTWHSADVRASELYAELVVDSDAAQPDAKVVDAPKLIGVVAQRRLGLARHALSLLVMIPFLVALLAFSSRFVRSLGDRTLRIAAGAIMFIECALATWLFASFDRELGKRDGNDGLQFIERSVLDGRNGLELFLGVDGLSIAALLAATVVGLTAILTTDTRLGGARRAIGGAAIVVSGAVLVLVAQTSLLLLLGWAFTIAGAVYLTWDSSKKASAKLAIVGISSTVSLAVAVRWMSTHTGGCYLVDGSEAAAVYAFPDLARAHFVNDLLPMIGLPGYRAAWLLSFLGCAAFLPLVPVHGWLKDLGSPSEGAESSPAKTVLVGALLPALSGYSILRLCLSIELDGARWGAESLPAIGVALLVVGGAWALVERDIVRLGAHLAVARGGLILLLAFSLTPHGIESAIGLVSAHAVVASLFYVATKMAVVHVGTHDLERLSGLGRSAPVLSAALVLGTIGLAAPIFPGVIGPLVGLLGSLGRNPWLTGLGTLGWLLSVAAAARTARVVFGAQPRAWRSSKYLEPFGGVLPDLRRNDLLWAGPLFILALLLAAIPRAFVGPSDPMIRDLTPKLDPDGPTRVAALDAAFEGRAVSAHEPDALLPCRG